MKLGCVILASGSAARFGENKLLAPLNGKPLLCHAFEAVPADRLCAVTVVTRYPAVAELARAYGYSVLWNPAPERGVSVSVALGTRALADRCEGLIYLVGDQPLLRRRTVQALLERFLANPDRIVVPAAQGRQGNPCVFPASLFSELAALRGDRGGKQLVCRHPELVVEVTVDPAELADVDTLSDLQSLTGGAEKTLYNSENLCYNSIEETERKTGMSIRLTCAELAKYIDHTCLKPQASADEIRRLCAEARELRTASVCVNPAYVKLVSQELAGTDVVPCCVIGFPLGASTPNTKAFEAAEAVANGAGEVDMVLNVGAVKSGDWALVERDIAAVVTAVNGKAKVKVILETCLLTDEEKVLACMAAKRVGADFVKTSTGFSSGGATVEDVRLLRRTVGPELGVKASGGVRTFEDALAMIEAGASRIGASSGKAILEGCRLNAAPLQR